MTNEDVILFFMEPSTLGPAGSSSAGGSGPCGGMQKIKFSCLKNLSSQ
jgi:hypothetical protein